MIEERPFLRQELKEGVDSPFKPLPDLKRFGCSVSIVWSLAIGTLVFLFAISARQFWLPGTEATSLPDKPTLVADAGTSIPRETPTEIPTETPILPTPRPEDTQTPVPTNTATPTNTPTATATSTNTPVPSGTITLTRLEDADTVYIVAGPGVGNLALGTLAVNEVAEVIGRTSGNEWLKIMSSRGIEGWVADCEVVLSSMNLNNIPVTWSGLVTAKDCEGITLTPPPPCVTVSITRTDWPGKEFDDILLSWSNVPSSATRLGLSVTGPTNDGETAYVIHPTFSDINVPYKVELFKFEDGDFVPGATYTYVVRPYNAAGNIICTTEATFVP